MTETPTRDDDEGEEVRQPVPPPPPPDWLTAQAKAAGTARAKPPRSAYVQRRRWQP
jgi:hypothetical protein